MKTFLLALAIAALPFQMKADVLTYNISQTFVADPVGKLVSVAGNLDIPLFDPALGTLDSIQYRFGVGGFLTWTVVSSKNSGYVEFWVNTDFSFLGVTDLHGETGISGGSSNLAPCGLPDFPTKCMDTSSAITHLAIAMDGKIKSDSTSVSDPYVFAALAGSNFVGLPQASLNDFIGVGTKATPFSIEIEGIGLPAGGHGGGAFYDGLLVLGDLTGPQTAGPRLTWTYNYTAAAVVDPPTVTPEPRTSACLIALVGLLVIGRKALRLSHI